jgi:hypothetical protein
LQDEAIGVKLTPCDAIPHSINKRGFIMKEISSNRSANGRHGLVIVGPDNVTLPAEGSIRHVGRVGGVATYEFTPGNTGQWITVEAGVEIHGGAVVVAAEEVQGSQVASLVLMGAHAVIEQRGDKRKAPKVVAYVNGELREIQETVLATMGLLESTEEIQTIKAPPALGDEWLGALEPVREF